MRYDQCWMCGSFSLNRKIIKRGGLLRISRYCCGHALSLTPIERIWRSQTNGTDGPGHVLLDAYQGQLTRFSTRVPLDLVSLFIAENYQYRRNDAASLRMLAHRAVVKLPAFTDSCQGNGSYTAVALTIVKPSTAYPIDRLRWYAILDCGLQCFVSRHGLLVTYRERQVAMTPYQKAHALDGSIPVEALRTAIEQAAAAHRIRIKRRIPADSFGEELRRWLE